MNRELLLSQQQWIREELTRCIRFWLLHGWDHKHGGVYTNLDEKGRIICTDKSVWMQGRCAWMFSYLCRIYGRQQEWLDFARSCLEFAEAHCVDHANGRRMRLTVTCDGHPIVYRPRFHSEGFYCIANAEFYGITGEETYLKRAQWAYELYWQLYHREIPDPYASDPMAQQDNRAGLTCDMHTMDLPMIYLNICSVMRRCHPEGKALYDARAQQCVDAIFRFHYKADMRCTLENVGPNGEFIDTPFGRQVNPGHDIELSWFLMEYANYTGDKQLHRQALSIFQCALDAGWDKEYGGLLNLLDCQNMPPPTLWYHAKTWWQQTELLIASLMAYRDTQEEQYHAWFTTQLEYCKKVFSDPVHGEWYDGFLRDNTPPFGKTPHKGNINKGPFHVLRALCMTDQMLTQLLEKTT